MDKKIKSLSKRKLLLTGMVTAIIGIIVVSFLPTIFADTNSQQARVVNAFKIQAENKEKEISGKGIIAFTFYEDFTKHKHNEDKNKIEHLEGDGHVKSFILIDGKQYEFIANNIPFELKPGLYDISGTYDQKINKFILNNAKYLGEVFNGDKNQITKSTMTRGTGSKVMPRRIAVFLVDFKDTSTQPFYPNTIGEIMFGDGKFKRYFQEASYGRQQITGDVFGWYTLPRLSTQGSCQAEPGELASFIEGNSQINLNNYGHVLIISLCNGNVANGMSYTSPIPTTIGNNIYTKVFTWVNISASIWNERSIQMSESAQGSHDLTNLEHILIHEFGHALGLHHPGGISCTGVIPNTDCENINVGNYYDIMSYNILGSHINAWAKNKLGWFNTNELKTITQSGIYEIRDLASQENIGQNQAKAYRIKPSVNSSKTPIWIEFRNGYGFDGGINTLTGQSATDSTMPPHDISENTKGLMIYKEVFDDKIYGAINEKVADLMYLRGSPNLQNPNPYQVSLNPGQTFSEPRYGLTITTLTSNNPSTRRFQVSMNPGLTCQFLVPDLKAFSFNSLENVPTGTARTINIYTKNMDYISCPSSSFEMDIDYSVFQPNGAGASIPALLANLAPDDERHIARSIWIPSGTPAGTYNLTIRMTNINSGLYTETTIPITVQ